MDERLRAALEKTCAPAEGKTISIDVRCPTCLRDGVVRPSKTWVPFGSKQRRDGLIFKLQHETCGDVTYFFTTDGQVLTPEP